MPTILLVEDEEVIRAGIKQLIHSVPGDISIVEAEHGQAAFSWLSSEMPDVVITDIRMRAMDGLTLIGKIRDIYPDMPIMIITGHGEFEYARQALRYGVCEYLLKPIDRKAFVIALEKILGKRPIQIAEDEPIEPADGSNHWVIPKIKKYVADYPDRDLTLQTLADMVHLNPAYLSHLFKQETELNLSDYITLTRLERAKYLLKNTPLKIYDIAQMSGFQSPKYFMLVFKNHVGISPGAYREASK